MSKPRLLDLFCGAGGAAMGYARAGFDVVGVDIEPQKNYPFNFVRADALEVLESGEVEGFSVEINFDAIHASPPCQGNSVSRTIWGREHEDLLTPTRERLLEWGGPYIIENTPPWAPMRPDFILCGSQFGEPRLKRHRWFEVNWPSAHLLPPCTHGKQIVSVFGHGGHVYHGVDEWREVMGIDWMTRDELAQAIPPAYTEYIGLQLIDQLARVP